MKAVFAVGFLALLAPIAAKNIVQLAESVQDLSTLVAAVVAGDLADTLSSAGPFTVFAPTNEAFSALPAGVLESLMKPQQKKELVDILTYHVLPEKVLSTELKPFQAVKTVEGKPLHVTKSGDRVRVGSSLESKDLRNVIKADNLASNGVVHIIDGVLLPPAPPLKNIVDLAASTADLSTLVTALTAGKLTGALSGTGPFTVFAPINEAFARLPKATLKKLLDPSNIKELDALLEYHVISGAAVHKADLKLGRQYVKTLEGKKVEIYKTESGEVFVKVRLSWAKVIAADVGASNGVVHIINHVLDGGLIPFPPPAPSKSIVQLAAATPDLSTLVTALKAGNLINALSGTGPFTVFAPTNEAFAKLPKATLSHLLDPKNIKELDATLEYHVISGAAVFKADLKSDQKVKTLEGQDVEIKRTTSGEVLVNQAKVATADVAASNGVVHIIDSVLMIPTPNIVQLAERTLDLSTLVSAVVAGDLADTLSSAGKFTVFAPTNEAFKALPAGTLKTLMKPQNKGELVDILTYHVLPEQVLSTQLKPFQAVKTVEGKLLHVQEWGGKVRVGPSLLSKDLKNVIKADNVASNGVVHIIDGVLLPPSALAETIIV